MDVLGVSAACGVSSEVKPHVQLHSHHSMFILTRVSTPTEHLHEAITLMGGVIATAKYFKVTRGAVYQWFENGLPANRVLSLVEALDHQVSAKDLRPDVFGII